MGHAVTSEEVLLYFSSCDSSSKLKIRSDRKQNQKKKNSKKQKKSKKQKEIPTKRKLFANFKLNKRLLAKIKNLDIEQIFDMAVAFEHELKQYQISSQLY